MRIALRCADASTVDGDVIGLKYAQELHGVDGLFAERLGVERGPAVGEHFLVACPADMGIAEALFIGVRPIFEFRYEAIRRFSSAVLEILAGERPHCRRLVMTLHGPGYGLDETEAALAEIAGIEDAIRSGHHPKELEEILIAELDPGRVERLRKALVRSLGSGSDVGGADAWATVLRPEGGRGAASVGPTDSPRQLLDTAGSGSEDKPHVFVAMPFDAGMDDVFHYGIKTVFNGRGWLCERVDRQPFIGDILQRVLDRVRTAKVVIADLTGANPNVYLELGYAWGTGRPTILIARSDEELRFDVRGRRCLRYTRIQDLEAMLGREIDGLQEDGSL